MTGTSSFRTEHASGFTLIELLVVMTIMALVAAIAIRQFGMPSSLGGRRDRQEVLTLLGKTRLEAQNTGKTITVKSQMLPKGYTLVNSASTPVSLLTFYPDGSASGGAIMVGGRAIIAVNWISGFAYVQP